MYERALGREGSCVLQSGCCKARREEVMTAIGQREQEGFDTWQIREERSIWTGVNAVVEVGRLGGKCYFALTN